MSGIKHVKAERLVPGTILALPFNKTATITEVTIGMKYVNFKTEYGKSRVTRGEEILVTNEEAKDA